MRKFTLDTIPFGVYSLNGNEKRICTAIDNYVVDLYEMTTLGYFKNIDFDHTVFEQEVLNDFIGLGKGITSKIRSNLQNIFSGSDQRWHIARESLDVVQMHLPIKIGDYTDFYSSQQHAYNVGAMFRDPEKAILPNWKHMPVAYHGRASSIVVSGTNFRRPKGQINASDDTLPIFSPTKRLDFELEMATIIGRSNELGTSISADQAEDYVFGFSLFNDWSARDIQRWEYVPLGPFLSKNFISSLGAWIIPLEALEPFRIQAPNQDPAVLPYLEGKNRSMFDIKMDVYLNDTLISQSNFSNLYWTVAQQIAHHTVNGCNLNVGDVLASGTISGSSPDSYGSILELTYGGKSPITLNDGTQRSFIEDGDSITIEAYASIGEKSVYFGKVTNQVIS